MMRILLLAFAILVLCPLQVHEASAKSLHEEFMESWEERLARYNAEHTSSNERLKIASSALGQAIDENRTDLEALISNFFKASDEFGYTAARSAQVQALIKFMEEKPSSARAELWFQEQIAALSHKERETRSEFERVGAMRAGENGVTVKYLSLQMGGTVFRKGDFIGAQHELQLINDNLSTYYRIKGERDAANRAKWAAVLGSLGQSLQAQSQSLNGFTMNCRTFGRTTNCIGN